MQFLSLPRLVRPILLACVILACPPARAVDGVREINQTSALVGSVTPGDTAGFPVEIFTSASFRLTSDLVVPAGASAGIAVYATGTRIDLNGFTISGGTQCSGQPTTCTPVGNGVGIDASGASDVRIQNGRVSGFGVYGIFLYEQGTVAEVTVVNNAQGGINGEEGCVVEDSIVRRNGGIGIQVGAGSRIASNVVHRNGGLGISAPISAVAKDNAVSLNVGSGPAGARNRRFYMTRTGAIGSTARAACAAGFHMASLWEIYDPTSLSYDAELGLTGAGNANDDLGSGPPAGAPAWVRTGWFGILTPTGAGQLSCTGWTNGTIGQNGSQAALRSNWGTPGAAWPWDVSAIQCNFPQSVWCIED